MEEVWELLAEEYGQVMELTSEVVDSMVKFQFPKEAKNGRPAVYQAPMKVEPGSCWRR